MNENTLNPAKDKVARVWSLLKDNQKTEAHRLLATLNRNEANQWRKEQTDYLIEAMAIAGLLDAGIVFQIGMNEAVLEIAPLTTVKNRRRFFKKYTRTQSYHRAILAGEYRTNLDGSQGEAIVDGARQTAQKRLDRLMAKKASVVVTGV